jgi:seryl-tRNA synthetase
MIDPDRIRENPEVLTYLIEIGRLDSSKVTSENWLKVDADRRSLIKHTDDLKAELNAINKTLKGKPDSDTLAQITELKNNLKEMEEELGVLNREWKEMNDWIPNIPLEEVPAGATSADNIEIKAWHPETGYFSADKLGKAETSGEFMPNPTGTIRPHWEIGEELGMINLEAGAKVSGSRFYYLKGDGALLILGVFNLLFRKLLKEGFSPMIVPLLVKDAALYGSGHFPGDADQVYKLENKYLEDTTSTLNLVGSSEPRNDGYFGNTTLNESELPIKVMAQTACFRSEVGSWGKDVRGIKRTHQFDKLEMNMIVPADIDKAREVQEYLLSLNEWLLQELKLPYHVINMCHGELGYYAAAKKYDIEVWLPSEKSYIEIMSNSITTDYQTRRLGIKYKTPSGETKFAYTLNDTGATHRLLIAILEHYQNEDGSVTVPEALRDYVGKDVITK